MLEVGKGLQSLSMENQNDFHLVLFLFSHGMQGSSDVYMGYDVERL